MFKEQIEKIKSLITVKEGKGTNKRKIENIALFILLLIVIIIVINSIWSDDKSKGKANSDQQSSDKQLATQTNTKQNEDLSDQCKLEEKLKNILSKITGVGTVEVLVTYSETSQVVAMYNENSKESSTEEKDSGGGNRLVRQTDNSKEVIYTDEDGKKVPVTQKMIMPKIEGAVILAKGASDVEVKTNIISAVEAATGLALHKIQVFEME